ncbi:BatA domain-containing protein [Dokdonia sp. Hel_I_53]|uniref:BatA domain-containing protein n=1 Tax=Dokdonia sp. Hel_I_53 TaxID=1566287 RepID=UPI00119B4456|nr:BatA domain-containing protein [Dokdonia sp. Hel_I_53]TVZ53348.1 putative membrane protein (TIGR02226 family) [Dokdonia sp. Hel_I_53]
MTLLQPSYLWGLSSLLVPIAIHLWSRNKVRVIKVGSTQFIAQTKSNKSTTIQLNELWLLVLRCLMLTVLVFIIAKPFWTTKSDQKQVVYVFEPSLLATATAREKFKDIPQEDRLLLASGFPEWREDLEINHIAPPNYWQLAQETTTIAADSIVIFTNAFAKAIKGKRPTINSKINWIVVDSYPQEDTPIVAVQRVDSTAVIYAQMKEGNLSFYDKMQPSQSRISQGDSISVGPVDNDKVVPLIIKEPIQVTILSDQSTIAELYYLEAAFRAISKYTYRDIRTQKISKLDTLENRDMDYLISLIEAPTQYYIVPTLELSPDPIARKLIAPTSIALKHTLTRRLSPKIIEEKDFVPQLLDWMQLDIPIKKIAVDYDYRTVPEETIQTNYINAGNQRNKVVQSSLSSVLWVILILLLFMERLVASARKQ